MSESEASYFYLCDMLAYWALMDLNVSFLALKLYSIALAHTLTNIEQREVVVKLFNKNF